ncbi:hypothetical protein [Companilactobacillus nantensis]|uniref:IpaB EvcA family protein n=1 Tax=Companilactobacillus nantensis DSM 16982 TaxID=1423774 RepID=A0A0R1WDT2_9LACO|nr:hypothetical protein [Companilactobacillus nantensis]KRM15669.1 hypothetical protein FD31_GL001088 [Companilactobacillus nantensis DSM 16982]GEO64626.1 hypothetical protein LNA01_18090 [Companilactobacillus nantensis]
MKRLELNELPELIVKQVEKIEQQYNKKIEVFADYEQQDYLTLDQADHVIKDDVIKVSITNEKYAEFVLSHELHHIELELSDEPSISAALTTGKQDLDGRVLAIANSVFETLEHVTVMKRQQEDGTYTDEVKTEYLKGINAALHPKVELDRANMRFYRTLIMLDGMIFSGHAVDDDWQQEFAMSYKYADKMAKIIEDNDLTVPFQFRRALVNTLDAYNEIIISNGYQGLHFHTFLNVTPVVSKRQLRLSLNQVYQIKHSEFKNRATGRDGFVLIGINDGQGVATLNLDPQKVTPEFYKTFYQYTVEEVFKEQGTKYLIR